MDDRFIGYRGSQENEWSWEPEKPKGPSIEGTRGARTIAFAVLSAVALVTSVVFGIYLAAGMGDDGGGPIVSATTTPTKRPTASPTVVPSNPPATATAMPTATPAPTQSPTPIPGTPGPGAEMFLWNPQATAWQNRNLEKSSSGFAEGDVVVFLTRISGVKAGATYEVAIDYFDCDLSPGQSFDYLTSTDSTGDAPLLTSPGPGRARPDSRVPVPDDPSLANDSGNSEYLTLWGGAFQRAPSIAATNAACAGDKKLTVTVLAQSTTLYLAWGGHLASAAEWPKEGSASAKSEFGMSAGLQGAEEARLEVLPGAISR